MICSGTYKRATLSHASAAQPIRHAKVLAGTGYQLVKIQRRSLFLETDRVHLAIKEHNANLKLSLLNHASPSLNYSPSPDAIFFVIARSLVHDVISVLMPTGRIFVIQP
jgi:hypothetical protein